MAKNIEFDVINNCNREIRVAIGNRSSSIQTGKKIRMIGEEGKAVEVSPHNASYTRVVGYVTGATIVVSGYDK